MEKIAKFFAPGMLGNGLALLVGAMMTLAFAPFHLYLLAIILPAILFGLWHNLTPQQAFNRGWLFGLGMFGTGVYWVFISIHTYGNASVYLAGIFTIGLISILAVFPALNGYLLNRFFPSSNRARLFCAFPALWVSLEWVRSWIFTGFPWLLLGNSQIHSPLKGYAALFGVYSLSLLVLISSGLLVHIIVRCRQQSYLSCGTSICTLVLIGLFGSYFNMISWTTAYGSPIQVSLVQGNISQTVKWSADSIQPTLALYQKLSALHWDSQIIIWPEAAIPISLQSAEEFLNHLDKEAKQHHSAIITGVPVQLATGSNYYNALIALGNGRGFYVKHRLVPFGEYVPFSGIMHKLLDVLNIPMSDFVPAASTEQPPLEIGNLKIASFICYEIAFPELVFSRNDKINLLLVVSNDAWFGHSIAQAQHLEIAQMRALEMGRPVLFVSNNGITAALDPHGKILAAAPPYETQVLTLNVQPMQGKTPWQYFGMDPVLFTLFLFILLAIRAERMSLPARILHRVKGARQAKPAQHE